MTTQTPDRIGDLREQINELDLDIIRLVRQRAELSRQVQEHRLASGGVRLALDRERIVLASYRDALGESGTTLGEAILRACRGSL